MSTPNANSVKKRIQYGENTVPKKALMRSLDYGEDNGIEVSFRKANSATTMMTQVNNEGKITLTSITLDKCVLIYRPKEPETATA